MAKYSGAEKSILTKDAYCLSRGLLGHSAQPLNTYDEPTEEKIKVQKAKVYWKQHNCLLTYSFIYPFGYSTNSY